MGGVRKVIVTVLLSGTVGCADAGTFAPTPQSAIVSVGNAVHGQAVWAQKCAMCHTAAQAFDLAAFHFDDTTIVRRALKHTIAVDAWDIVAHVQSLTVVDTLTPASRPFQPGGVVLSSDQEFGIRLFGVDQWPANITRAQLLAQDPRNIRIALPLLVWSDESSNFDWLPGSFTAGALPAGVRAATQNAFNTYTATPSTTTALALAKRIRKTAHDPTIADAPCLYSTDRNRYDAQKCGDVGKWIGAFLYVEGLRSGDLHGAAAAFTGEWWETGHLFHKAQQFKRSLPMRDQQIAAWMHLGWMWNRALNKKASYEAGPLAQLGLNRHATWLTLRSLVERSSKRNDICSDVETLAQFGANQWAVNALRFAYRELQYRDALDLLPTNRAFCVERVRLAQQWLGRRSGAATRALLQPLADSTSALIGS